MPQAAPDPTRQRPEDAQTKMANEDLQMKLLAAMESQNVLMERQLAQNENSQKTQTLLIEKIDQVIGELQTINQNTGTISHKIHAMELRQWYHSTEQKDCLRAMDQYSKGVNWTLSKAQVRGIQNALESGSTCYGDLVTECDRRRAEHQVVQNHYKDALPADQMWQMGCIALRCPKVQEQLIQNGLPRILLDQFAPSLSLLEKLRDAPAMADVSGAAMSSDDVQAWEQKAQFNGKMCDAVDGWASSSQVSADIQSAVAQPTDQDQQMNQDVADSQML